MNKHTTRTNPCLMAFVGVFLLSSCASVGSPQTSTNAGAQAASVFDKQENICIKWRRLSDVCHNHNSNIKDNITREASKAKCMESRAGKQKGYEAVPVKKPSYCY